MVFSGKKEIHFNELNQFKKCYSITKNGVSIFHPTIPEQQSNTELNVRNVDGIFLCKFFRTCV